MLVCWQFMSCAHESRSLKEMRPTIFFVLGYRVMAYIFFLHFFSCFIWGGLRIERKNGFWHYAGNGDLGRVYIFSSNLIRSALVKLPMYSSACFMNNASVLCEDNSFDDPSKLAEEFIEWAVAWFLKYNYRTFLRFLPVCLGLLRGE